MVEWFMTSAQESPCVCRGGRRLRLGLCTARFCSRQTWSREWACKEGRFHKEKLCVSSLFWRFSSVGYLWSHPRRPLLLNLTLGLSGSKTSVIIESDAWDSRRIPSGTSRTYLCAAIPACRYHLTWAKLNGWPGRLSSREHTRYFSGSHPSTGWVPIN